MTDLEQNEMDSGLWVHRMEMKKVFGVTDRKGFSKVVCIVTGKQIGRAHV